MKRIPLGNTGYKVSRIGFGGIPISRLEYAKGVKVVHAFIDMGVNFMDTAVAYKDSEIKIGEAIAGHDIIVATKSQSRYAARDGEGCKNVRVLRTMKLNCQKNKKILSSIEAEILPRFFSIYYQVS